MKRFIMLALVAAFLLSSVCTASAADIKAKGQWKIDAIWTDNYDFLGDAKNTTNSAEENDFQIEQRIRTTFEFIANENLKGVMEIEAGTETWGMADTNEPTLGGEYAQRSELNMRQAYLDFNYPGTDVNFKIGKQIVTLPAAVGGSPIIGGDPAYAAQVTAPINDMFTAIGGYSRLVQTNQNELFADLYYVAAPVTLDGISFVPYFGYVNGIDNATAGAAALPEAASLLGGSAGIHEGFYGTNTRTTDREMNTWWLGTTFEMTMFDPFVVKSDLIYGTTDSNVEAYETAGWFFDASLEYTGLDYMTPKVFFVYSSGDDESSNATSESGDRMPVLNNDWSVGSFFFGGSDLPSGDMSSDNKMGFWALGATISDISFIEKMTHTFTLLYAKGTNDANRDFALNAADNSQSVYSSAAATNYAYGATLTDEDSIWEIDFNTKYALYDELTAVLELGYIDADFDKTVWGIADEDSVKDAYKVGLGVIYEF